MISGTIELMKKSTPRLDRGTLFHIGWGLIVLVIVLFSFWRDLPGFITPKIDFAAEYLAAQILNNNNAQALYDDVLLHQMAVQENILLGGGYPYPPFLAAVVRPLALVPFPTAELVWMGFNLVLLFISARLLLEVSRQSTRWRNWLGLFAVLLIYPPEVSDLSFGQLNTLLPTLATLAAVLLMRADSYASPAQRENPRTRDVALQVLAGALIGLAAGIKLYPGVLLLPLIVRRRYAALLGAFGGIGLTLVVGRIGGGGWENIAEYVFDVLPHRATEFLPINQSLYAVVFRLIGGTSTYNFSVFSADNRVTMTVHGLIDAPQLVLPLTALLSLAIFGVTLWALWQSSKHRSQLPLDLALTSAMFLMLFPQVEPHYYTFLLLPFAVWIRYKSEWRHTATVILLVLSLLLVNRFWKPLAVSNFPFWLLLFGLAAAFVSWLYALYLMRTRSGLETAHPKRCN